MVDGEDDPGVEELLFERHQHGELSLPPQLVDDALRDARRRPHLPGGTWGTGTVRRREEEEEEE